MRNLIAQLNAAQLIKKIKIVDEYSEKQIAEIMEGAINEDVTVVKKGSAESMQPLWQ